MARLCDTGDCRSPDECFPWNFSSFFLCKGEEKTGRQVHCPYHISCVELRLYSCCYDDYHSDWGCFCLSPSPPRIAPGDMRSEPQRSSSSGLMSINCHDGETPSSIEPVLTENDPIQLNRKPSPACSVLSHPHLLGWQITFYLPPNTGYIHTLEDGMHAVRYD